MFDQQVISAFSQRYAATLVSQLGLRITAFGDDSLTAHIVVNDFCLNSQGRLHGGMTIYLVETLSSFATIYRHRAERGLRIVGVSVSSQHIRGAGPGESLTFVTKALRKDGRIDFWKTDVLNASGELVNMTSVTVAAIEIR